MLHQAHAGPLPALVAGRLEAAAVLSKQHQRATKAQQHEGALRRKGGGGTGQGREAGAAGGGPAGSLACDKRCRCEACGEGAQTGPLRWCQARRQAGVLSTSSASSSSLLDMRGHARERESPTWMKETTAGCTWKPGAASGSMPREAAPTCGARRCCRAGGGLTARGRAHMRPCATSAASPRRTAAGAAGAASTAGAAWRGRDAWRSCRAAPAAACPPPAA